MFVQYFKGDPSRHVLLYRGGSVVRSGVGISFFYTPHDTSIVSVPVTTQDAQFVVKEMTANYQDVAIQGHLTYRVADVARAVRSLDFSLDAAGRGYRSEDSEKLPQRIVDAMQSHLRPMVRALPLAEALASGEQLAAAVLAALRRDEALAELGVSVESLYVVSIAATPEMKKALEAEYRETLNQRADLAIYTRRTAALEEERKCKQAELDTEVGIELGRRQLVSTQAENRLKLAEADAKAEQMKLEPYATLPTPALVALALREWAGGEHPINQLNVTPDLLSQIGSWLGRAQPGPRG